MSAATINPNEAAHFGALAADWWDPKGSSAMLHRLNPVRLKYLRDQLDQHWQLDEHDLRPLVGRRAADVGCGAGLLAEPLARLGATPSDPISYTGDTFQTLEAAEWAVFKLRWRDLFGHDLAVT